MLFVKVYFLFLVMLRLSYGAEPNHNNLLQDHLPFGIHQYRINYSLSTKLEEMHTTTLLGCYHSMLFSSLQSGQQRNLEELVSQEIAIGNECATLYHTRKLKRYMEILFNMSQQEELLRSSFFTTFTKLRFASEINPVSEPMIGDYFSKIMELFQSEEVVYTGFMKDIGLDQKHYPVDVLKIFEDKELVMQLPSGFLYDFVNCYIKHTSVESHLLRSYLCKGKQDPISLDNHKAYFDNEAPLFESSLPDFSTFLQTNHRSSFLDFYNNLEWLFSEESIPEKFGISETTLHQLKLLCYMGQKDRCKIFNTVLTRRFMEEPQNSALKRAYSDIFLDMKLYNIGSFIGEESLDNIQRNRQWLCKPLKQLLLSNSHQNSLIMFGASHLGTLKKGNGVLNFLFDLWTKQHQDEWSQLIGSENLNDWNTSIHIYSIERLNKSGDYNKIKLTIN